jgi:hypothetical protein
MHVAYAGSPRKSSAKGVKAASFQQHPAAVIAVITDKTRPLLHHHNSQYQLIWPLIVNKSF